jgi:hypothetical protein
LRIDVACRVVISSSTENCCIVLLNLEVRLRGFKRRRRRRGGCTFRREKVFNVALLGVRFLFGTFAFGTLLIAPHDGRQELGGY